MYKLLYIFSYLTVLKMVISLIFSNSVGWTWSMLSVAIGKYLCWSSFLKHSILVIVIMRLMYDKIVSSKTSIEFYVHFYEQRKFNASVRLSLHWRILIGPPSNVFFQLVLISRIVTLSSCLIWQIISLILPLNEYGCVYAWTTLGNIATLLWKSW